MTTTPPDSIAELDTLLHLPLAWTRSGIYFLCEADEVVYVGRSLTALCRIAEHIKQGVKEFSCVFFLPCLIEELDEIEQRWIKALEPKYNYVHTGRRAPRRDYRRSIMSVHEGRWSDAVGRLEYIEGKNGIMFFSQFEFGGEVVPMNFMALASPEQTAEWNSFMTDEVFYECLDRRR